MDSMTLLEMFIIIRKKKFAIAAGVLIFAILSFITTHFLQTYTASVTIQYRYENASEGLTPNGEKLNPYEIMDPVVVSRALSDMRADEITVEEIRSQLVISKIIDSPTQEIINASTEKGEEYVHYPTEYIVTFTYDNKYGTKFGKKLLYNIMKAYDYYFINKYYKKIKIVNFLDGLDIDNADYMDIYNQLENNLTTTITDIGYLEDSDNDYRSCRTGMKFSDLINFYTGLQQNEYNKYYANIREGHLTKDKDKFIATYKDKVEATTLLMNISSNESLVSKETLLQFYNQYKSALNYDVDNRNSQVEIPKNKEVDETNELVYGYDLSLLVNTYDDMILRYMNTGVTASSYECDIDYYNSLIHDFSNDKEPEEQKSLLLLENSEILNEIDEKLTLYEKLAKETIEEYYNRLVASDIKQVLSVEVRESFSKIVLIMMGAVIGFLFTCIYYIWFELLKRCNCNICDMSEVDVDIGDTKDEDYVEKNTSD